MGTNAADQTWKVSDAPTQKLDLEVDATSACLSSPAMKMFLGTMVFTGMNTEDIQVVLQPLMVAYSTVFQELGDAKAKKIWSKAYKGAKFMKVTFPSAKEDTKFAKLMGLKAKVAAKKSAKKGTKKAAAKPAAAKPAAAKPAAAKPAAAAPAKTRRRMKQPAAATIP